MRELSGGMVERVAEALAGVIIAEQAKREPVIIEKPWGEWGDEHRSNMRTLARAAIGAMREPTEAMYDALSATDRMWRDLNSTVVWRTMIDAALADGEVL